MNNVKFKIGIFLLIVLCFGTIAALPEVSSQQNQHPEPPAFVYDVWPYFLKNENVLKTGRFPLEISESPRPRIEGMWWPPYYEDMSSDIKLRVYRGGVKTQQSFTIDEHGVFSRYWEVEKWYIGGEDLHSSDKVRGVAFEMPNLVLVGVPGDTRYVKVEFPSLFDPNYFKKQGTQAKHKFYFVPIIPLPEYIEPDWQQSHLNWKFYQNLQRAIAGSIVDKYVGLVGFPLTDFGKEISGTSSYRHHLLNEYKNENNVMVDYSTGDGNNLKIEFKLPEQSEDDFNFAFQLKEDPPIDEIASFAMDEKSNKVTSKKELNYDESNAGVFGIYPAYKAKIEIIAMDDNENEIAKKDFDIIIGTPRVKDAYRAYDLAVEKELAKKLLAAMDPDNKEMILDAADITLESFWKRRFMDGKVLSNHNCVYGPYFEISMPTAEEYYLSRVIFSFLYFHEFSLCRSTYSKVFLIREGSCKTGEQEISPGEIFEWVPNLDVKFFFYKYGLKVAEVPKERKIIEETYSVRWNKCTKDNTAKRPIHPKRGKFGIGDKVSVEFTAFAENVGNVSIQCNQNCYYECDICKDDKKGYVPNLKPNEKGDLIESCDKQKTKNFEVVFRANDTQIKNLQKHFGANGIKKLASNEVPLEVAILTRKDCQENGKYYVEPNVLCVLFVTNKTEISLLPPTPPPEGPPPKPGKKVKKAIVKIGGVTEVCCSPWSPHRGTPPPRK